MGLMPESKLACLIAPSALKTRRSGTYVCYVRYVGSVWSDISPTAGIRWNGVRRIALCDTDDTMTITMRR